MHLNNLPELKGFRKELRSSLTPAEARLWTMLKGSSLRGRKFRRQHSLSGYIFDFYCPAEKLAVELDGEVHFNERAAEYDYQRKLFLKYFGILVLRFENRLVFEEPEYVLDRIKERFGWNKGLEKEAWIDDVSFSQGD
jgi:very-short-patch-repair endonuclease